MTSFVLDSLRNERNIGESDSTRVCEDLGGQRERVIVRCVCCMVPDEKAKNNDTEKAVLRGRGVWLVRMAPAGEHVLCLQ